MRDLDGCSEGEIKIDRNRERWINTGSWKYYINAGDAVSQTTLMAIIRFNTIWFILMTSSASYSHGAEIL